MPASGPDCRDGSYALRTMLIAASILGLGGSPSAGGQTLALALTFLGIGIIANVLIAYAVAPGARRAQGEPRAAAPASQPPVAGGGRAAVDLDRLERPLKERRAAASNQTAADEAVVSSRSPARSSPTATRRCRPTYGPDSTISRARRRTSPSTSSTTSTRPRSRPRRSSRGARTRPRARSCASRRRSASRASPSFSRRPATSTGAVRQAATNGARERGAAVLA